MVYVTATATATTHISNTVEFFPSVCTTPHTSSADSAKVAAPALIHALLHPAPAAPFDQLGNQQSQALHQLAHIFEEAFNNQLSTTKKVVDPMPRTAQPSPRVAQTSPQPPPRVATRDSPPPALQHRYPKRSSQHSHQQRATITTRLLPLISPSD
jgi:hypothetical protein